MRDEEDEGDMKRRTEEEEEDQFARGYDKERQKRLRCSNKTEEETIKS